MECGIYQVSDLHTYIHPQPHKHMNTHKHMHTQKINRRFNLQTAILNGVCVCWGFVCFVSDLLLFFKPTPIHLFLFLRTASERLKKQAQGLERWLDA